MSLTAAASGFVVFLLCVQVIQSQNDRGVTYTSTEICALKGSTVVIRCSYWYPYRANGRYTTVQETLWLAELNGNSPVDLRRDSQYSGRVEHSCENNNCTLRIRDVRESDSAKYKFRFITSQPGGRFTGSPGVTLSITDLQVKVERSSYPTCLSSCQLPDHPSYIWYKNGQEVPAATSRSYSDYINSTDSFSCAVKGQEAFPSPPVCVIDQTCNRVTYTQRSICAFKGSSVDISCTYNSHEYISDKYWFNPKRSNIGWQSPSQHAARVQVLEQVTGSSTLRISDLTESDSAEYHFKFRTQSFEWRSILPGTTLTVTALQVQVIRIKVTQSQTHAELKCLSSCRPAGRLSYVWFKNKQKISWVKASSYKGWFKPSDTISCALEGHENYGSPPVYAPKRPSVSVSPSGEIVEGSSVNLTCSSDANPAATYTWYERDANFKPLSEDQQLVFSSIQSSDSGEYYCSAENKLGKRKSTHIRIDVKYAPKLPSVSVSPSGEIVEGSSVTLTCSSDAKPAATYTWYKENQQVFQGQSGIYRLTSISSEDRGNYHCKSENRYGQKTSSSVLLDVQYPPKLPSVSVSPSGKIMEGSSVTLTCSSDAKPAATYTWYKENQILFQGPEDDYHFTSISSEDRGNYNCKSENRYGQKTSSSVLLDVQYAPKLPSVSVSPSGEIVEGSSVTLICSSDANPAADYTWYKKNANFKSLSEDQQLVFSSIQSSDSGEYYCTAENELGKRTSAHIRIDVKYAPKLPSVSVRPSGEIVEGSSVTLTCSSDANPAANYTWYKENQRVIQGPEDDYHLTPVWFLDSGNYHCKSENEYGNINSTSVHIDVLYPPKLPSVSVSPSGEIVEGSSVTLTCSSDANPAANYTWYKENEDSLKATEQIFIITDLRAEDSGNYYCEVWNKLGHHNSTVHLNVVSGPMKSVAAESITAVFLVIILLSAFLLIRRKMFSKQTAEQPDNRTQLNMGLVCEIPSAAVQRRQAEEQDDLCYARVSFSKNQEDTLYFNIRPAQLNKRKNEEEEEEDAVEYTAVKCERASASPQTRRPEDVEDLSALYSTVSKTARA